MKITILSLFPQIFDYLLHYSILQKAQSKKLLQLEFIDIRKFSSDKYSSVDGHPYGGGLGMIMRVDTIDKSIAYAKNRSPKTPNQKLRRKVVLLDPRGNILNQKKAWQYSRLDHLIIICGHYEGVDERVLSLVDETVSVGDYILTGGEIPAMIITDAVTRLIPGVLKNKLAVTDESFDPKSSLLSYPQYTEPRLYKKMPVPPILLSGNHNKIKIWREHQALKTTKNKRPDLLRK